MNRNNYNLLTAMAVQSNTIGEQRFIVIGSVGRAAVLGDNLDTYHAGRNRLQDIDAIDTEGMLDGLYTFADGSILDCKMTRTLRPAAVDLSAWEIYNTHTRPHPPFTRALSFEYPILDTTESTLAPQGIPLRTLTPSSHIGIVELTAPFRGPLGKHKHQLDRLRSLPRQDTIDYAKVASLITGSIEQLEAGDRRTYTGLRDNLFRRYPTAALFLSETVVGSVVRHIRKSQPESAIVINSLAELIATETQGHKSMSK